MIGFLKVLGIVVASLVLLIVLIVISFLFIPFRYKIWGKNKEYITAGLTISFFLSIFRLTLYYKDLMGYARLRIFGIKIFDNTFPEIMDFIEKVSSWLESLKKQKNEETAEVASEDVSSDENELTEEEIEEYLNEDDKFDNLNSVQKNKEFLWFIKDWVLNIKKKWYNFKEFVDQKIKQWNKFKKEMKFYWKVLHCPSLKPTLVLLKDVMFKVIKHVFPKKLNVKLVYGDEDDYLTAKVLGYCYMIMGMFGDNFDVTPVWGESVFDIDGYIKGRVRIAFMLSIAWKLFSNKHLRRMIRLFIKGGNIRGGK